MIKLTEAEWEIMKVLWDNPGCSLSAVVKTLNDNEIPWAMNTVHTLLGRLVKKNAAAVDKSVSPHIYTTVVDKEMCGTAEIKHLVKRIYGGSINRMFSSLLVSENLSEYEISELKEIINNINSEQKPKKGDE